MDYYFALSCCWSYLLYGADFDGVGTEFVAVAGDNDSSKVLRAFFDLEVITFELTGESETEIFGIGADKGGVGIAEGKLVGNTRVGGD